MIVLKDIDMTLDANSIGLAIKAVQDFRGYLGAAMSELIRQLTEQGVEIAKAELLMFDKPAFYTGELHDSIYSSMQNAQEGVVATDVHYAVYVEYGTGEFAKNGDGRKGGWRYFNDRDGKWHFTIGMEQRPFMYNTMRSLENIAENNGARIIAEYIP